MASVKDPVVSSTVFRPSTLRSPVPKLPSPDLRDGEAEAGPLGELELRADVGHALERELRACGVERRWDRTVWHEELEHSIWTWDSGCVFKRARDG